MSAEEWTARPYVVGEENVAMVGVKGIVEAITSETLTIDGVTLPRRMGGPVRYLSMIWPDEPGGDCDREHVDDTHSEEHPEREALADLVEMIRERHDGHPDSMRFCSDPLCRVAADVDAVVLA